MILRRILRIFQIRLRKILRINNLLSGVTTVTLLIVETIMALLKVVITVKVLTVVTTVKVLKAQYTII